MDISTWRVSATHLEWIPTLCRRHNIRVEKLLSEVGLDIQFSFEGDLLWPTFTDVVSASGRYFSLASLRQAGATFRQRSTPQANNPTAQYLQEIPDQCLQQWGPAGRISTDFPIKSELLEHDKGYLCIKMTSLDERQACHPFFHFIAGQMESLASMSGKHPTLVDVQEIETGAIFDIRYTAEDNEVTRVQQRSATILSNTTRQYDQLQADHEKLQKQQIKLRTQLTAFDSLLTQNTNQFEQLGLMIPGATWLTVKSSGQINTPAQQSIKWASPATLALLGYDASEILRLNPDALVCADSATNAAITAQSTADVNEPSGHRVYLLHRSGKKISARLSSLEFDKPNGEKLTWWLAAPPDTWLDSNDGFKPHTQSDQAITEASPDAIITYDDEHRIVYANPVSSEIFGYSQQALIGTPVKSLFPEALGGALLHKLYQQHQPATVSGLSLTGRHQNRELVPLLVTMTRHRYQGDARTTLIAHDLSHQVALQSDREALAQQLRLAQQTTAVGQLASGIVHDFNNLLVATMGYADLAIEQEDPEQRNQYLAEIKSVAQRGQELTQQILTLRHQKPASRKIITANSLINNVHNLMRHLLPANIDVQISIQDHLRINADPYQLEQVLLNLAINAGHAMASGGKLTIQLAKENAATLILSVSDTGCGMDPATQAKIFEPFFTTKPEGSGTGLGLSVARDIITQHQGTLSVTSTPGHGTRFDIRLPIESGAAPRAAGRHEPEAPATYVGNETVLVVEDNESALQLTRLILTAVGYSVITAVDAEQALQWVEAQPQKLDIALVDVVLPTINGYSLSEQLEQLQPDLPIILTTGYPADSPLLKAAIKSGKPLLPKPFGTQQLRRIIRRTLDAKNTTGNTAGNRAVSRHSNLQ